MSKVKTLLVGIGGYGDVYPSLLRQYPQRYEALCQLVGVVDPYAATAPSYAWLREQGIPCYDTLEEFYQTNTADLAVITTPIPCHKPMVCTALAHGTHVLCEKPLVPTLDDAADIATALEASGKTLGVGFQWSFSVPMRRLKADILAGKFGKPVLLKSLICWKRSLSYYQGSWKGELYAKDGSYLLDSVVTNATAHYLHNIFFVLGDAADTAAMPSLVEAEVYRTKDIASFDTVTLRGDFPGGGKFWFGATHSGDGEEATIFHYQFEKARIEFNVSRKDNHVYAFTDAGETIDYGNPQEFEQLNEKLISLLQAAESGAPIPCTLHTVLPHLAVCNGLFSQVGITDLPREATFLVGEDPVTVMRGLSAAITRGYETGELLSETGLAGTVPPVAYDPRTLHHFGGIKA